MNGIISIMNCFLHIQTSYPELGNSEIDETVEIHREYLFLITDDFLHYLNFFKEGNIYP